MFRLHSFKAAFVALAFAAAPASALEVGDSVPYLIVDGLDGKGQATILSLHSVDKPEQSYTLVGFMSVEDQVSRKNLATIVAQAIDLAPDVATRLVAVDSEIEIVKDFREAYKNDLTFPLVFDPQQSAKRAYEVPKVPVLFMVNFEGKVLAKVEGELTSEKVNTLRKSVGYEPVTGTLKVGDVMPAVALAVRFPGGQTLVKDVRKPDYAGQKYTVIALGSIYSGPSVKNLSAYRNFAIYSSATAAMRWVSVDTQTDAVLSYVKQYPTYFNYSVVLDPTQEVAGRLGDATLPATYVVNAAGKILYKKIGELTTPDVNEIYRLLAF